MPNLKELTTKTLTDYWTPKRKTTKSDTLWPLNTLPQSKKDVTNKIMQDSYKWCDNIIRKNVQMKLESLNQLEDSIVKEKENICDKKV